jgi:spermidine/putrescine transport system permease protein
MNADRVFRLFMGAYILMFLAYLFLPLLFMAGASVNDSRFPTLLPWNGFTLKWFGALFDDPMLWQGLGKSLVVGAGVIALSVPLGLAAALLLTELRGKARGLIYGVLVSPILMPGVIIGISTLVFWRQMSVSGGVFLTVLAQSSFIASYCMLMFMARLQRFDRTLEEAALDLGASHLHVVRRIMLPYLMPTILSAVMIAFLQSFENYNTTLFVYGTDRTLPIYLASKVRIGLTPAVNALGVIFIALTIVAAVIYEWRRRVALAVKPRKGAEKPEMQRTALQPVAETA